MKDENVVLLYLILFLVYDNEFILQLFFYYKIN